MISSAMLRDTVRMIARKIDPGIEPSRKTTFAANTRIGKISFIETCRFPTRSGT
jgi:hypothetical protein